MGKWGEQYQQKPVAMSLAEANGLLNGPHSSEEAIRAAYKRIVRASHPDTADLTQLNAHNQTATIGKLQAARDVLLSYLNQGAETPCKLCGGSGRVGTGFGAPCAACHGTGHQNG